MPIGDVPFRDSVSRPLGETWWLKSSPHTYLDTIQEIGHRRLRGRQLGRGRNQARCVLHLRAIFAGRPSCSSDPGTHCGWTQVKTDTGFDIVAEELRFFDYWLKGVRNGVMDEPAVTYYTYNAPPEQAWRRAATLAAAERTCGRRSISATER